MSVDFFIILFLVYFQIPLTVALKKKSLMYSGL